MAKVLFVKNSQDYGYTAALADELRPKGHIVEDIEVSNAQQAARAKEMLQAADIAVLGNIAALSEAHRRGDDPLAIDPLQFAKDMKDTGKPVIVYGDCPKAIALELRKTGLTVIQSMNENVNDPQEILFAAINDRLQPPICGRDDI